MPRLCCLKAPAFCEREKQLSAYPTNALAPPRKLFINLGKYPRGVGVCTAGVQALRGGTGTTSTGTHETDPCDSPSAPQLAQCGWVCGPPPRACGTPMESSCAICALLSLVNKLHHKTRSRENILIAPLQSIHTGIEACLYVYTHAKISEVFYSHLQFFSFATTCTVHTIYSPSPSLG